MYVNGRYILVPLIHFYMFDYLIIYFNQNIIWLVISMFCEFELWLTGNNKITELRTIFQRESQNS